MVAMQALRRDVLRWLVTLNLSFPIKNIKRDFSNGFLVAEILSHYYPMDIQMHSFDYGMKLAKKRDNWDQLKKIFWKVDFPFFQDEIENIINCGRQDGVGPLLERLYGFLTHKRYKPENADMDDIWLGFPDCLDAKLVPDGGMPTLSKEECSFLIDADNEACFYVPPEANGFSFQNVESTGTMVEHMDGEDTLLDEQFNKTGDVVEMADAWVHGNLDVDDGSTCGLLHQHELERKNYLNAVERARQKEKSKTKVGKAGFTVKCIESGEFPSKKSSRDICLAFRSPNRQRQYKMYTLTDYKRQQAGGYVMLGKLGPEMTEFLTNQREKRERMKEFGRTARSINVPQVVESRKPKEKSLSCREKDTWM